MWFNVHMVYFADSASGLEAVVVRHALRIDEFLLYGNLQRPRYTNVLIIYAESDGPITWGGVPVMTMRQAGDEELQMLVTVSRCAVGCCILLVLLLAALSVSGTTLAVRTSQAYQEDEALRATVLAEFSSARRWHGFTAFMFLVPLLLLVALSILFSLHVGSFAAKRTKRPWTQSVAAVTLALLLVGGLICGNIYSANLRAVNFWLTPPSGGFSPTDAVAKGQGACAMSFSTFIAIHGILFPAMALLIIIMMWPAFYEFAFLPKADSVGTNLKLTRYRAE